MLFAVDGNQEVGAGEKRRDKVGRWSKVETGSADRTTRKRGTATRRNTAAYGSPALVSTQLQQICLCAKQHHRWITGLSSSLKSHSAQRRSLNAAHAVSQMRCSLRSWASAHLPSHRPATWPTFAPRSEAQAQDSMCCHLPLQIRIARAACAWESMWDNSHATEGLIACWRNEQDRANVVALQAGLVMRWGARG